MTETREKITDLDQGQVVKNSREEKTEVAEEVNTEEVVDLDIGTIEETGTILQGETTDRERTGLGMIGEEMIEEMTEEMIGREMIKEETTGETEKQGTTEEEMISDSTLIGMIGIEERDLLAKKT